MADGSDNKREIPEFYANGMQLAATPFDLSLTFGLQNPQAVDNMVAGGNVPSVFIPSARVRMSPQLAVVMTQVLQRTLEVYETQNGKIPISEELIKKFDLKH